MILEYREGEFRKIASSDTDCNTKIKLVKNNDMTNWLDITETELQKIMQILTK